MALFQYASPAATLLCGAAVLLWATALLPEYQTALLFFLFAVALGIASPDVAFSGFTSPALWLVFSGLVVGLAIRRTSLGERFSRAFLDLAPTSYFGIMTALVLLGFALSFFMPSSMGRVVMIVPIAVLVADQLGMAQGSRSRGVLIATAALGAYLPSASILPANIPNLILASGAESLYGITFRYADYFVATFPTIGFGKLALIVATGLLLSSGAVRVRPRIEPMGPMQADEKKLAMILIATVVLWATDAVHGINPAWIGLAAAIACLLPGFGMLNEKSFNHELSWAPLIHTAGIIGLGAVVASSGLGEGLGRSLTDIAPFATGHSFWNFMLLVVILTIICLMTTTPGLPAVATPLAGTIAEASGLPLQTVLLAQALAFSTIIFPYQGAPLVFAFYVAGVPFRTAVQVLITITAGSILIIAPLTYLWWRVIGILP